MASKKVLSIAMEGDFQDKVKVLAEKKKISVSQLIREACEKHLFVDDGCIKLVLTIPADIAKDGEKVEVWLNQRFQSIINHLKSSNS